MKNNLFFSKKEIGLTILLAILFTISLIIGMQKFLNTPSNPQIELERLRQLEPNR
ncbi:hypothetical protein ACFL18_02885 [Patescibacteria group bacterium]